MITRDALILLSLVASAALPAVATPAAMNEALQTWRQRMTEYRAAVDAASTPEEKAAIELPASDKIASALWKSISGKTGQRDVLVQPSAEEKKKGAQPTTRRRDTYEFEEDWAAPAVVWFVNNSRALARIFKDKPRQLSFYADALLDSIERHHYASPVITDAIAKLTEDSSARVYGILEKIYTRNQDPTARGCAALGMSIMLGNPLVAAEAGSPAMARGKRVYYLRQALSLTPEDTSFGGARVADVVVEQTYLLKHLAVGSIPEQVSVRDTAGREQKLPVVGKPNLIFFWNPADPTSTRIAQKLPSLTNRYPGLLIAPVTAYAPAEELGKSLSGSGVPMTYVDDAKNSAGTAFRVAKVPTAVLLSERCTVLYIGYPDMHLQTALDSCFENAKASAPRVRVSEEKVIQPGSTPTSPGKGAGKGAAQPKTAPAAQPSPQPEQPNDEAPALREMPEF